ncbi:hypothetical protein ACFQO7_30970, partial [Catellatospora aurea]
MSEQVRRAARVVRVVTPIGMLLLLAGLILLAPGWWAKTSADVGGALARHWPATLLITAGIAAIVTSLALSRRFARIVDLESESA